MKTKNNHKRTTFTMIITTIDNINNKKSQWAILTWGWSHSNIPRGADALQWPNFTSFLITSLDAIPSNCSDFLRLEIYLRKKKHTEGLTNVCGIMYVHILPTRTFDLFQLGLFRARTNLRKKKKLYPNWWEADRLAICRHTCGVEPGTISLKSS